MPINNKFSVLRTQEGQSPNSSSLNVNTTATLKHESAINVIVGGEQMNTSSDNR